MSVDILDASEQNRPPHQQYVQKPSNLHWEICLQAADGLGDLTKMVCTGCTRCFQGKSGKENLALI